MDLTALMKLAEENKEAACSAFSKRYGSTKFSYSAKSYFNKKDTVFSINSNHQTVIESIDFLDKFLNHFGHLLKEFEIVGNGRACMFNWTSVFKLICKHCTMIQKLRLHNDIDGDFIDFFETKTSRIKQISRNPLILTMICPTLEELIAENIYFIPGLKLPVCFPKLKKLDLLAIAASKPSFIEVHLPNLNHFGIMFSDDDKYDYSYDYDDDESVSHRPGCEDENEHKDEECRMKLSNIEHVLRLNSQLKSLYLEMDLDVSFVELVNEILPNLEEIDFTLWSKGCGIVHLKDVVFKNVTVACLGRIDLMERPPPISFENLKSLQATIETITFRPDLFNYIKKNQFLTHLDLKCDYNEEQALQLVQVLPKLQTLNFVSGYVGRKKWSVKSLLDFLVECEKLDSLTLTVYVDTSKHTKSWRTKIASAWKITNDYEDDFYLITKIIAGTRRK